jgi:hypothetical protein
LSSAANQIKRKKLPARNREEIKTSERLIVKVWFRCSDYAKSMFNRERVGNKKGNIMGDDDNRTEKIISAWLAADPATQDAVLEMLQTASDAKKAQQLQGFQGPPRSIIE